jgi:hypothetical protein
MWLTKLKYHSLLLRRTQTFMTCLINLREHTNKLEKCYIDLGLTCTLCLGHPTDSVLAKRWVFNTAFFNQNSVATVFSFFWQIGMKMAHPLMDIYSISLHSLHTIKLTICWHNCYGPHDPLLFTINTIHIIST